MDNKTCSECKIEKTSTDFRICHDKRIGKSYLCSKCRECERKWSLARYHANKEICQQNNREYKEANKIQIKQKRQEYLERTKDHVQARYKEYCKKNKDKINQIARDYKAKNIHVQIKQCLTNRLRNLMSKQKRTEDYLGTSIDLIMKWFEFNFGNKYSWENRSTTWHIDHTIPVKAFDMDSNEDVFICFSWMNTMPLSRSENIRKHDSIQIERINHQIVQLRNFAQLHNLQNIVHPYLKLYADKANNLLQVQHNQIAGTP